MEVSNKISDVGTSLLKHLYCLHKSTFNVEGKREDLHLQILHSLLVSKRDQNLIKCLIIISHHIHPDYDAILPKKFKLLQKK